MAMLRCEVVRWVSDEPWPGWVEARISDVHGRQWTLFDKPPIFESENGLTSDALYPQQAGLACEVIETVTWPDAVGRSSQYQPKDLGPSSPRMASPSFQVSRDQLIDPSP